MNALLLIAIIVIVLLLIVWDLLMLTLLKRRIEYKLKRKFGWKEYAFLIQWLIGLVIVLSAAIFVFDGDILGKKTTGIAWFIGSGGLCLIVSSFFRFLPHHILP